MTLKNLVPGSLVLGQVTELKGQGITLSLPNNLTGHVPLPAISPLFAQKLRGLQTNSASPEADKQANSVIESLNLNNVVRLGQYLRAQVTSVIDNRKDDGKSKRGIELSIVPSLANFGITQDDLAENLTLQVSVESIEDHGLIMDLGLPGGQVKGYLSLKDNKCTEIPNFDKGSVLLCTVIDYQAGVNVVKLKAGFSEAKIVPAISSVNGLLPGTAVSLRMMSLSDHGIVGMIIGGLRAIADSIHSSISSKDQLLKDCLDHGKELTVRMIYVLHTDDTKLIGVTLLDHVLKGKILSKDIERKAVNPLTVLPLSSIVDEAEVLRIDPLKGLLLDVQTECCPGFCHISKVSDSHIKSLTRKNSSFGIGSKHRARVIGFSSFDGVYYMSLQQSILDQPFLRLEDVNPGAKVKATIRRISVNENGVKALVLNLTDGVVGVVPSGHFADITLQHPERKFRVGQKVMARVLTVNSRTKRLRLTLKKSLMNFEENIWTDYNQIKIGDRSNGSITKLLPSGAVIYFFGKVRAFLPRSEMSEAYVDEPIKHFRIGQTVNVRALSVVPEEKSLTVSCLTSSSLNEHMWDAFKLLRVGTCVDGTVLQMMNESIVLSLLDSNVTGILRVENLSDGSLKKNQGLLRRMRIGQTLKVLVCRKFDSKPMVKVLGQPSVIKWAEEGHFICNFADLREGQPIVGTVKNITNDGVFVSISGDLIGLLPSSRVTKTMASLPAYGLRLGQTLSTFILAVDHDRQKFLLSMQGKDESQKKETIEEKLPDNLHSVLISPVDPSCKLKSDYYVGKSTLARIVTVKESQLNVELASGIQGRVHISEVFDDWDDIKDRKRPLRTFKPKQVIPVKILGIHNAKTHRYLPISHKNHTSSVFELAANNKQQAERANTPLSLENISPGSMWIGFVNNITEYALWVNLSPNVRGRVDLLDLTNDFFKLQNLEQSFPIGSAMKVKVKAIDAATGHLDLVAKRSNELIDSVRNLRKGSILPGRVTKSTDHMVFVQLSRDMVGSVAMTELTDDFSSADPKVYSKNTVLQTCVLDMDNSNNKLYLSLRPSRILSSTLPVKDRCITSVEQLALNDTLRGFVKNVDDKGLFVSLGYNITAFVRVCDLFDEYVRDWKSKFQTGQLVKGKVIHIDSSLKQIQMSLKESAVNENYVPPLSFSNIISGQCYVGTIRKVEDFGVFVVMDNSTNVSGLCHKSEIADIKVNDIGKIYHEGDRVKVKVLSINKELRRINLGLKASYFKDGSKTYNDLLDKAINLNISETLCYEDEEKYPSGTNSETRNETDSVSADSSVSNVDSSRYDLDVYRDINNDTLDVQGFDWAGKTVNNIDLNEANNLDMENFKQKRKRKTQITVDETDRMDVYGPQSDADFERLLLAEPNSSSLWVQYMALQVQLSDIDKARQTAERALRTIHIREDEEKQNIWIAMLNLENTFGTEESLDDVFSRACQFNDSGEMSEKLASIFIESEKYKVRSALQ